MKTFCSTSQAPQPVKATFSGSSTSNMRPVDEIKQAGGEPQLSAPSSSIDRSGVTTRASSASAPRLPLELTVQVLRHLCPSPVDLLRLGAASQVRRDVLATAAREPCLWARYNPERRPRGLQLLDPATQFVARLDAKAASVRAKVLREYDRAAKVAPGTTTRTAPRVAAEVGYLPPHLRPEVDADLFCATWSRLHGNFEDIEHFYHRYTLYDSVDVESCRPTNDPAVMATVANVCAESAFLASRALLNDPSYLHTYALRPPCRDCADDAKTDWRGDPRMPFPFHRLDEVHLQNGELIRSALQLRPDSYINLPESLRRDPQLFLDAVRYFEGRWPCAGDKTPNYWGDTRPTAFFREKEDLAGYTLHPAYWVDKSVYHDTSVALRAVESSPVCYIELPFDLRRSPVLAHRFLTHVDHDARDTFFFEDHFTEDFPAEVRADLACMRVMVEKGFCSVDLLGTMSSLLAGDTTFVTLCAQTFGIDHGEVIDRLGRNFGLPAGEEAHDD